MNPKPWLIASVALIVPTLYPLQFVCAKMMPRVDVVAVAGGNLPLGSSGTTVSGGVINDEGQVAFTAVARGAELPGAFFSGVYRGDASELTLIARNGQPRGDGLGVLTFVSNPFLNGSGQLSFLGTSIRDDNGQLEDVVYVTEAITDAPQIVAQRLGDNPGGGVFTDFSPSIRINGNGDVAFQGEGTGSANRRGIYFGNANTLTQIDPGAVGNPVLNDVGQLAWIETLALQPQSLNGLFFFDGTTVIEVARTGDPVPDGGPSFTGTFQSLLSLNEAGTLAFGAVVTPRMGQTFSSPSIFVYEPGVGISEPVVRGSLAPDGNGVFDAFFNPFVPL